ncbi:MAG: inositol monophosphatase family protein [Anaerolineales bacterium]
MNPTISDLEDLARQAGEILRAGFGTRPGFNHTHNVDYKGVINPVTEIDRQSESYLVNEIHQRFPSHSIVAEESGGLKGLKEHEWFIDPLDGTVNFTHGVPIFSVSIAYANSGEILLGVVYDPNRDECFSAQSDKGAWLNGEKIRVSSTDALDNSLLVTGFPYDIRTNPQNNLDYFAYFSKHSQGVRRLGSAAMDLCYVANGRFDGFWEMRLNSWDVAAGGLIAREAGAVVTNMQGGADFMSPPQSILAANPTIHPLMLQVFHKFSEIKE